MPYFESALVNQRLGSQVWSRGVYGVGRSGAYLAAYTSKIPEKLGGLWGGAERDPSYFLSQGISLALDLTSSARLSGQRTPGIFLSVCLWHQGYGHVQYP